ncbi:MAG: DUF1080 domain-containing protein [Terriglobia bacterium]
MLALPLALLVLLGGHPLMSEEKWIVLFDGKSTDAWRASGRSDFPSKGWVIDDHALKTVVGGDQVDLITKEKFHDFELELEWKVTPRGNGGVFYRGAEKGPVIWMTAPEYQVVDDDLHPDGKNPKTSAASLYALIAPTGKKLRPVGQYNQLRIVFKDNHVKHWLNGIKVLEYTWGSQELKDLIAHSKFNKYPGFAEENSGHIGLQHHGQEVWYRNIRIRKLP